METAKKGLAGLSDEDLMRSVQEGSHDAFELLHERYLDKVRRLCFNILRNEEDASDATQDAFLSVFRFCATFAYQSTVSTWLYRIAYNSALMVMRRRKSALIVELVSYDEHDETLSVRIKCPRPLPDEELIAAETNEHIARAMNDLDEAYRTVFVLRDVLGMSLGDIAVRLGLTRAATKSRLHRARETMRNALRCSMEEDLTRGGP